MWESRVFTGNVLGAFADRLSEQLDRAAFDAAGLRRESQAILVTLVHEPDFGPTRLGRTLGISTPSVVHLLNRLEGAGLLERRPGTDGRRTAIAITGNGRRAADGILAARRAVLADVVDRVPERDRSALHNALVVMAASMTTDRQTGDHICRRCDESACPEDACPVECALLDGDNGHG